MSNSQIGHVVTEETRDKISKPQKGKKRKPHTEKTIKKMSKSRKGRKRQPFSEEWKRNISKSKTGENNPMFRKHQSSETKLKQSKSHLARPELTCPHCEKTGGNAGMKRWHFDNCKYKKVEK